MEISNATYVVIAVVLLVTATFFYYIIPVYWRWQASLAIRKNDELNAIECLNRALRFSPRDAKLWFGLGVTLRQAGRLDEALSALDRACELEPGQVAIFIERADVFRMFDQLESARNSLDQALNIDEFHVEARLKRVAVAIESGRFDDAEFDCNWIIDNGDESGFAEAYNSRGVARLMLGHDEEAEADFETSYLLDPRSSVVRAYCAGMWLRHNMPKQTLRLCDATIKSDPDCGIAYYYRASAKELLGDKEGANLDRIKSNELKSIGSFRV